MTLIIAVWNLTFNIFFMKNNSSKHIKNNAIELLGLSRREAEVMNHVAEGKTSREVSTILRISERTVDKHLENIYGKLGARSRTEAVALALQAGVPERT